MDNVVFGKEAGHLLPGKISSIVGDDYVRDSEATYYILPEELDNLLPADFEERYYLDPFGKVAVVTSSKHNWGCTRGRGSTMSSPHCIKGHRLCKV